MNSYKYVYKKDIEKAQKYKGIILKDNGVIVLVQNGELFTVWNPESGLIIVTTFYIEETNKYFITKE